MNGKNARVRVDQIRSKITVRQIHPKKEKDKTVVTIREFARPLKLVA